MSDPMPVNLDLTKLTVPQLLKVISVGQWVAFSIIVAGAFGLGFKADDWTHSVNVASTPDLTQPLAAANRALEEKDKEIANEARIFNFQAAYLRYLIAKDLQSPDLHDARTGFVSIIRNLYVDRVLQLHRDDLIDKTVGPLGEGHVRLLIPGHPQIWPIVPEVQQEATASTAGLPGPRL